MFDSVEPEWAVVQTRRTRQGATKFHSLCFAGFKRVFDYSFALSQLPLIISIAVLLLIFNPRYNPGSVFFVQTRMGKHGKPFRMIKFRTMLSEQSSGIRARSFAEGVEEHRITRLGGFLRRFRIDELPNLFNVLLGEMSVIGPRPDVFEHALEFVRSVPHYRERHRVRPGISGLAQVEMGYAEGVEDTGRKALLDVEYVDAYGFRQEASILFKTIKVVLTGYGSK